MVRVGVRVGCGGGRTSGEHDVLVEASAAVDGRALDGLVDDEGDGGRVVGVCDLRVEEDLWAEEALVGHVTLPRLGGLCEAVDLPKRDGVQPKGRAVVRGRGAPSWPMMQPFEGVSGERGGCAFLVHLAAVEPYP